jgi:hypothetical protein
MRGCPDGSEQLKKCTDAMQANNGAIVVAIDQYAEAATGNRDFFLNKPPPPGSCRDIP